MFVSLKFYIQVVEVLHSRSGKNSAVSLSPSFPKKAENALAFLHILLTSCKKIKIFS